LTAWSPVPRHCSPLTDTQGQSTDLEPFPNPKTKTKNPMPQTKWR
jgi:hypothetical protein